MLNEPPPDIDDVRKDVPKSLVELLFRLLAKDPAHRPQSAREVATHLEAVLSELITYEGTADIGEYMTHVFDDKRKEDQQSRAELVRKRIAERNEGDGIVRKANENKPRRFGQMAGWAAVTLLAIASVTAFGGWAASKGKVANEGGTPSIEQPARAETPKLATDVIDTPAPMIQEPQDTASANAKAEQPKASSKLTSKSKQRNASRRNSAPASTPSKRSGNRPWVNQW